MRKFLCKRCKVERTFNVAYSRDGNKPAWKCRRYLECEECHLAARTGEVLEWMEDPEDLEVVQNEPT